MSERIYMIRLEILKQLKRFKTAPVTAAQLYDYSMPKFLAKEEVLEQWDELKLEGYIAPRSGFNGEYCIITEKGLHQLAPEFPQDEFIHGPGAIH